MSLMECFPLGRATIPKACFSVFASFFASLSLAPPPSFPQKVFLKRGVEKCPKLFPLFQP